MKSLSNFLIAAALVTLAASPARAFFLNGHWNSTATNSVTGPAGTPITLTWSIVPDGTSIPLGNTLPSNLISYWNGIIPGGTGSLPEQRNWFTYFQQAFDRWSALSGITFVYEPADDGVSLGSGVGSLNQRGDIRIGGRNIDGIGGTNASTGFINSGADITMETADTQYFGVSANGYRALRNTLTHEIGHSLGMGHSFSSDAEFLMESTSNNNYDGPQLDDIRGAQQQYGDVFEKSNNGTGNNTALTATDFGTFAGGQSKIIGTHASTGTLVLAAETDFVSITNHNDFDYFSFTTTAPTSLDAVLTPLGATYNENSASSSPINSSSVSNLALDIYRVDGGVPTLLQSANTNPIGQAESILGLALSSAGQYLARISGSTDVIQLYQLGLAFASLATPALPGDYNHDGAVDAGDYIVWRKTMGQTGAGLDADGDGDQMIDDDDYAVWRSNFGSGPSGLGQGGTSVPEPGSISAIFALFACLLTSRPRRKRAI